MPNPLLETPITFQPIAMRRRELAHSCGVSEKTIQRWELEGLPRVKVGNGTAAIYLVEGVKSWLSARMIGGNN